MLNKSITKNQEKTKIRKRVGKKHTRQETNKNTKISSRKKLQFNVLMLFLS